MASDTATILDDVFSRASGIESVAVVDGFGVRVHVERGHLVASDGIADHRRVRRWPRATRTLRRVVVIGHGDITTAALRWCADVGVSVVMLDPTGRVIMTSVAGVDDARLRRAQAAAGGTQLGLRIARDMLMAAISDRIEILRRQLASRPSSEQAVAVLTATNLSTATDLETLRNLEAAAAIPYFDTWATLPVRFAQRDTRRIPDHWHTVGVRRSPLRGGTSPRSAATPGNALLNYLYAVAETECRIACIAVGLDPGLGFLHADRHARDSLALDLIEPVRPHVERYVLELLASHIFRAIDFTETPNGQCRVNLTLSHTLSGTGPAWARAVAPWAEHVAHALADASPGRIAHRTPLTQATRRASTKRGTKPRTRAAGTAPVPARSCQGCGGPTKQRKRIWCSACWPAEKARLDNRRTTSGLETLARLRAAGNDPSQTDEARERRAAALRRNAQALAQWRAAHHCDKPDPAQFTRILPALASMPLARITDATGLSVSAASQVRSGKLTPHPRHWPALTGLAADHAVNN